jgi:hypothetical protein
VKVVKGAFADGSPMLAVPNFARYNRHPPGEQPGGPLNAPPRPPGTPRPAPPPPESIVWIRENG